MPPPYDEAMWNQDLLRDTATPQSDMVFTTEEVAADDALRDQAVSALDRTRTLGLIRDIANNVTAVTNLIASTIRGVRASEEASRRANNELALLTSMYGRQDSELLGAAAIRQARAMIANARTVDDIAASAVMLRRVQAAMEAERLSRESAKGINSTDVALLAAGALGLGLAWWRYARSARRGRR